MNNSGILDQIEIARQKPGADYRISALIGETEFTLATSVISPSIDAQKTRNVLVAQARSQLSALGFEADEIERAQLILSEIPDVIAIVDRHVQAMEKGGPSLVFLESALWEAFLKQTSLKAVQIGASDQEVVYHDLAVRPSAAS